MAMALYNHVANKDELLDGMVDIVFGEIESAGERSRLEDGDARAGDLGARGAEAPPLGDRPDGDAEPRARRTCATTTP